MPKTDTILSAKLLRYFLQLIDTMNYTQAAQILGITQPALTQQDTPFLMCAMYHNTQKCSYPIYSFHLKSYKHQQAASAISPPVYR